MNRRLFLALASSTFAAAAAADGVAPSDLLGAAGDPAFLAWLNGYYARKLAAGASATQLAQLLTGLAPDPRVLAHNASQPEFALPVSDYVSHQVTPPVVALAQKKLSGVPELPHIQASFGVPAAILVAIWRMESGFGANQGDMDVVRSLATLAAEDPRRSAWAEGELDACLKILQIGAASRAQLRGSWAGAMGQTQFEPSAFLATAVSADGKGHADIWGSSADALASAANLLDHGGWQKGQSWAVEVTLKRDFDYGLSEGPKQPPSWWTSQGAKRADQAPWSGADKAAGAQLLLPCGAAGPAFLAFANHFAIRTYNNSLAYALSVGLLADRIAGAPPLRTPWPKETPLSLNDRMDAQAALARQGYNPGAPDGLIGLGTRQALRAWQKDHHLPADGYLSPAVIAQLKAAMKG